MNECYNKYTQIIALTRLTILRLVLLIVLIAQPFSALVQTNISGEVKSPANDKVILMYWKDFSLITDTLLLDRNNSFSQSYVFTQPMYIRIINEISTPFMLVFPGESLHVKITGSDVQLSGTASGYNTFLIQLENRVRSLLKAKTDQNEVTKYALEQSNAFFSTFKHQQAAVVEALNRQSFIFDLKFFPVLVKYNSDAKKMETLKSIIQGKPLPGNDRDIWLYLDKADYNNEANKYNYQYFNMMNNFVRILSFLSVNNDSALHTTDAYLIENNIIKDVLPSSPLRAALLAYNLNYRITSYTDFPAQLGEVDRFIADFKKEDNNPETYLPIISDNYTVAKASFGFLEQGAAAPKFTLKDVSGKRISLSHFKGKVVYIDIWASWCGPCLKEMPYIKALKEKYKDKELEVVSISIDTNEKAWLKIIKDMKLTGVQLIDSIGSEKSKIAKDYHIAGVPHFVLIDKYGKIVSASAPRPSETILLEKAINALLK